MKLKEIYDVLNDISPFELQEKWDNLDLLALLKMKLKILHSMDLDLELAKDLKPNSLAVTHHPLIFQELKSKF
ncbi:MAG: Nif3-like dinuclear metal center hexameric protein [Aliarcobacter sp.]